MNEIIYGLTDTGRNRSNNEDTFIAQTTTDGKYNIACVIDGVGGYSGGEVAAALTREVILEKLNKPGGDLLDTLTQCFQLANQKIIEQKGKVQEYKSMACVATLALIDIDNNEFFYAHVGDTRLYLLRDRSLIKITRDQSFVGYLEESKRISEKEAMTHPKRNEINKALGFDANILKDDQYIETGQSPFLPGDRILLCSDGLTDMVAAAEINKVLIGTSTLQAQCEKLVEIANEKGGLDNITVVLAANDKKPAKYGATRPAQNVQNKPDPTEAVPTKQPTSSHTDDSKVMASAATNGWLMITLGILALAFLAGNVWQYLHNKHTDIVVAQALPVRDNILSKAQMKLEDAITHLNGNLLLLTDSVYTSPILINRAISIDRDTLFIKTRGNVTLMADTGYKGAALQLSPKCKLIMLDSLNFKNFNTGVIAYNNSLLLKKVQFEGCDVIVRNLLTHASLARLSGTAQTLKADTTPRND